MAVSQPISMNKQHTRADFEQEAKMATAVKLFEMYRRVLVPFVDTRNAIGRVGKARVVPL